ncbi:alpha-ribazole phosphatase [Rudanella lutea]|uniref:alpha-ribazole phosphatase n=1 Tax=Rudanella lutea TaxID=451374 RepID=UPI0003754EB2|nr:alpha-ribazole phosphatase [Rudanella lutea]
MEIYLIRHTEVAVGRSVSYGQSDVELAVNYEEQRDRILPHLPTETPAYLFSSPLSRCRLLANDLATSADVDLQQVQFDDRLKELHFGDWEMVPWADIPRSSLDPWMADYVNVGPPNGESFGALFERVTAFWQEKISPLAAENTGSAYIITHGGVIRALLCLFLDLSLQNAYRIHLDYGSLTKLTTNGQHFTIQYINR